MQPRSLVGGERWRGRYSLPDEDVSLGNARCGVGRGARTRGALIQIHGEISGQESLAARGDGLPASA